MPRTTDIETNNEATPRHGVAFEPLVRRRCPCGETRMQGRIVSTGEWICWKGHIITEDGKIAEFPADVFAA